MKDYPIDKWLPFAVAPLLIARRKWWPLKCLLVLLYFPWLLLWLPITGMLLFLSIGLDLWDSLDE